MKNFLMIIACLLAGSLLMAQEPGTGYYAADQSVFVLPTAHTMPKGSHALTSYELFLWQYSFAPTDRLHLSAGMVFPFNGEMLKTISLGAKYRYISQNLSNGAVWVSYTPDANTMTAGNVFSYGTDRSSLHLVAAVATQFNDGDSQAFFGMGGILGLSRRANLMGEVIAIPSSEWDDFEDMEMDSEYDGVVIFGLRFKGERISWDLGGIRFLEDQGDIWALPFVKGTFIF
ncbi:MAG TPA: hypothetical protein PLX59_03135 [Candidatus Cloacimonadota bacterium]|nr:hypothetical protein [Candidatus Cloacimonadota bacterium]